MNVEIMLFKQVFHEKCNRVVTFFAIYTMISFHIHVFLIITVIQSDLGLG